MEAEERGSNGNSTRSSLVDSFPRRKLPLTFILKQPKVHVCRSKLKLSTLVEILLLKEKHCVVGLLLHHGPGPNEKTSFPFSRTNKHLQSKKSSSGSYIMFLNQ